MDTTDQEMKGYYKERAPVYDRVYGYPERQQDLRYLEKYVSNQFSELEVIEVAAGTGYWTQFICRQAKFVLATDAMAEALAQIEKREIQGSVERRLVDAYSLDDIAERFSGAFAGLWFSHIPVERRDEWLTLLHRRLRPGATVLLLDNSKAQCEDLPLTHTDERGNTYQDRKTDSGETYRVLKNFPTEAEMIEITTHLGCSYQFQELDHFWFFQFEITD